MAAVVFATSASAQQQGLFGSLGLGQLGTAKPPVAGAAKPPTGIQNSNSIGQPVVPDASPIVSPQAPQAVTEIRPDLTAIDADVSKSQVFGAHLFTGAFARQGPTHFNPDYVIAIGDSIRLRLWGSVTFDDVLVVDAQGNIFMPNVGPVKVLGIRNEDLQQTIEKAARRVFKANVFTYASLAEAQPVRVFVGGFVKRPGLYNGTSMDSLLHYLDQAGGIDLERGSFLNVQVKRGSRIRVEMNLYEFLLHGRIPQVQLADGDVIFVSPRQRVVTVAGLAENAKRFEFETPDLSLSYLSKLAKPLPQATHIRVTRNTGTIKNVEYYPLIEANELLVINGDQIEFTADKRPGTITVRVQGEHLGPQEYELQYGARLGELVKLIEFSERSDTANVQLFRLSVKDRQKVILQTSLKSLEAAVLTARSATNDESQLRTNEANLILQWVERAKNVEPTGQVLISQASQREQLLLEQGDILNVPLKDGLVLVGGEVLFPNTIAYEKGLSVNEYIEKAGGYTQNADSSRVIIAHRDGSFTEGTGGFFKRVHVQAGDQILVLPKVDVKALQIAKDISQILFQMALMAGVVANLF
jgi:protein involved in polysaccharide export with SLBB domain